MSKTISAAFETHIGGTNTTLATCCKITLTDSTVKGFTSHDQNIGPISGVTYLRSGYTSSAVQSSSALNVDNLEIQGFLESPSITDADLNAGVWDFAAVEIFTVNWADLSMGTMALR